MTRTRINVHVEDGVAAVRGWGSAELLKSAGIRAMFARGAWLIDEHRLPDLLAELERRHIAVEVTGAGVSPVTPVTPQTPTPEASDDLDQPLWSDGGVG